MRQETVVHVRFEKKKITLITHKETRRYEVWKRLKQSKAHSASHTKADNSPTSFDDGRVGQSTTSVPDQVTNTVQAVVGERKGKGALEKDLSHERKSTERSDHCGRLEMPSESGGGEVSGGPEIEGAREGAAGDTVQRTTDPGDLGLVDRKVGSDGAAKTLLDKNLARVLGVRG